MSKRKDLFLMPRGQNPFDWFPDCVPREYDYKSQRWWASKKACYFKSFLQTAACYSHARDAHKEAWVKDCLAGIFNSPKNLELAEGLANSLSLHEKFSSVSIEENLYLPCALWADQLTGLLDLPCKPVIREPP